jgi:two-component system CheB/CheR fusion protein
LGEKENEFHIVGIGGSAGGLEAYEKLFRNMPEGTGMAFVLVPHLDPDHASLMPELIAKTTEMPVAQIEDGTAVAPDHVYIVPPNRDLRIENRTLLLREKKSGDAPRMPIDVFFRSLAEDAGEYAVGIVLSGMGMDGSMGLRAIKGELGFTMVQRPDTAKYPAMPRSAMDATVIDNVLPPEKMGKQLAAYVSHVENRAQQRPEKKKEKPDDLEQIFRILADQVGHDFSEYKKSTVNRRIERRMGVLQLRELSAYVAHLKKDPDEVELLFQELLIGVTSFFRDAEAFEAFKKQAAALAKELPRAHTIRVWVPGCASGEEAYSVAIVLTEVIEEQGRGLRLQVFATDIDKAAIEKARQGVYPTSIAEDVGEKRLSRFFNQNDSTFRIKQDIRESIVFAPQDMIKDPPFTKLDIISCRNLLIYLESGLQKKILPLFYYSLKPGGLLFLGGSESIGEFTDLLETADKKWKIYVRKDAGSHTHPVVEFPLRERGRDGQKKDAETKQGQSQKGVARLAEEALLSDWAPPSAIINEKGDILYIHGRTGKYLEPSPGEARFNIHEMAREGLKAELPVLIQSVMGKREPMTRRRLSVKTNGDTVMVDLTIKPLRQAGGPGLLMVSFEEVPPPPSREDGKEGSGAEERIENPEERARELEAELSYTKESLQSTIEEIETSNEELKSTNEELQSTNEELQSTNEELETSKEEQQSLNEELNTVNAELQEKIDQLTQANNDMRNLMEGIEIPVIFLDNALRIKRYTSQARKIANLIDADVGRPVSDITIKLEGVDLKEISATVLSDLAYRDREAKTSDGRWYSVRVTPYRTLENRIEGVVLTFLNVTELKKAQEQSRLATVLESSNDAILVWDLEGRIKTWNKGAARMYGYSGDEAREMTILDLVPEEKQEETRNFIETIRQGREVKSFQTQRTTKDGRVLDIWATVTLIPDSGSRPREVVTTERDLNWLAET